VVRGEGNLYTFVNTKCLTRKQHLVSSNGFNGGKRRALNLSLVAPVSA